MRGDIDCGDTMDLARLPGWMIDLKIRDVSDNRFSLDDVMRFLDVWYGEPEKGYPESGLGNICSAVAQRDLRPFFDRHIAGYEPFSYDSLLAVAGLRWNRSEKQVPDIGCSLGHVGVKGFHSTEKVVLNFIPSLGL